MRARLLGAAALGVLMSVEYVGDGADLLRIACGQDLEGIVFRQALPLRALPKLDQDQVREVR